MKEKMRLEREVLSFLRMMAEKWAMPIYYLLIRIYKNQNILQDPQLLMIFFVLFKKKVTNSTLNHREKNCF